MWQEEGFYGQDATLSAYSDLERILVLFHRSQISLDREMYLSLPPAICG